jgi:hypothetical protein
MNLHPNQTNLRVPQTDLHVPQTDLRVPQTDLQVPQTDLQVPQTDLKVPQTDLRVPQTDLYPYQYLLYPFLYSHELTPFFSPSLLRKEGECSIIQRLTPPLCVAERGMGGEFMGKVILFKALSSYTEGLINH